MTRIVQLSDKSIEPLNTYILSISIEPLDTYFIKRVHSIRIVYLDVDLW